MGSMGIVLLFLTWGWR